MHQSQPRLDLELRHCLKRYSLRDTEWANSFLEC